MGVVPYLQAYVFRGGYGQVCGTDEGVAECQRLDDKKEEAALGEVHPLFERIMNEALLQYATFAVYSIRFLTD